MIEHSTICGCTKDTETGLITLCAPCDKQESYVTWDEKFALEAV